MFVFRKYIETFINLFKYSQQFYGQKVFNEFSFSMFYSEPPYADLIFQDATQKIIILDEGMHDFAKFLFSFAAENRRIELWLKAPFICQFIHIKYMETDSRIIWSRSRPVPYHHHIIPIKLTSTPFDKDNFSRLFLKYDGRGKYNANNITKSITDKNINIL